jgi:hypothetical protein
VDAVDVSVQMESISNLDTEENQFGEGLMNEEIFQEFHGYEINLERLPIESLAEKVLARNREFPVKVVQLYSKIRFFARLRQLNSNIRAKKKSTRVFKQYGQFLN